jgi:hypothetical protein
MHESVDRIVVEQHHEIDVVREPWLAVEHRGDAASHHGVNSSRLEARREEREEIIHGAQGSSAR